MAPPIRFTQTQPPTNGQQPSPGVGIHEDRQPTPEGNVRTCTPSEQPHEEVVLPLPLVQQIAHFIQRQENNNQARSFRFSQVEAQLASLRAHLIPDQGSPNPRGRDKKNPSRSRHHQSSSEEENTQRSPKRRSPKHRSSWASSSPVRERSRSPVTPRGRERRENDDSYQRRRPLPRPHVSKRRNPFSRHINNFRVPRWLEKPPEKLPTYSGVGDPDRHISKYEDVMDYRYIPDEMRCRIFPLSLDGIASEWLRSLKPESISGWDQLAKLFCDKFGHSRSKPKGKECLLAVKQRMDEPLRDYIERFNSEASTVRDLDDEFRIFFMIQGLFEGSDLKRHVRRWVPKTLQEFLQITMNFINEEEGSKTGREMEKAGPSRPQDNKPLSDFVTATKQ